MDISLPANTAIEQDLINDHNAFIYVIEGDIQVQDTDAIDTATNKVVAKNLAVLSKGANVKIKSNREGARFLLIAGQPLNEPIARMGPFVMNTQAEIRQAVNDFHNGKFG